MQVSKLHATGNDFLVVAALAGDAPGAEVARALCDRHRGVGADGLLTLLPGARGADATMELRNADGGIAEMSGNGARCLAWVAVRDGLVRGDRLVLDTGAGRREVELWVEDGQLRNATVDMGPVTFDPAEIPIDAESPFGVQVSYHGVEYEGDAAGVGNPHLVLFVDDVGAARVVQHGPHLERDERFPKGVNVEFVAPAETDGLEMRVWERGVGETLSCGTGACAAAAVAHHRGLVGEQVLVHVRGGDLKVTLSQTVLLGGPVEHLFDVDVDVDALVRSSA